MLPLNSLFVWIFRVLHLLCNKICADFFTNAPFVRILAILEDAPIVSSTLIDGAFCLLRFVPDALLQEMLVHATERSSSPSSSASASRSQSASPTATPVPVSSVVTGRPAGDALQVSGSSNSAETGAAGAEMHSVSAFVTHMSPTATTAQYRLNAFASASYDSHDSRASCSSLEPEGHQSGYQSHPSTPQPQTQTQPVSLFTASAASPSKRFVSVEKSGTSHSGSSKSGSRSGSRPGTARTSPSSSANSSSCNSIDAEEVQDSAGVKVGATISTGKCKVEM